MRRDKIDEINRYVDEVTNRIHSIQLQYLMSNSEYPYNQVNELVRKYKNLYDRLYLGWFVFGDKRKGNEKMEKIRVSEMLCNASELTVSYIVDNFDLYVPNNDSEKYKISSKLYPIIANLSLKKIISLYDVFKINISKNLDNFEFDEASWMYLQQMFVGYISVKVSQGRQNNVEYFEWSYNDICEVILKESDLTQNFSKKKIKRNN